MYAVAISLFTIAMHLSHYTVHQHQRFIVRILIMVLLSLSLLPSSSLHHCLIFSLSPLPSFQSSPIPQVPVYAIDAWFSLRFLEMGAYLELIRHCYEAYTLYLFFMLLVNYLEGEENIIAIFGVCGGVVFKCLFKEILISELFQILFDNSSLSFPSLTLSLSLSLAFRIKACHSAPLASQFILISATSAILLPMQNVHPPVHLR